MHSLLYSTIRFAMAEECRMPQTTTKAFKSNEKPCYQQAEPLHTAAQSLKSSVLTPSNSLSQPITQPYNPLSYLTPNIPYPSKNHHHPHPDQGSAIKEQTPPPHPH